MARRPRHGLDELMIVNPGTPGAIRAVTLRGVARAVDAPEAIEADGHSRERSATPIARRRRRLFLGSDGTLYEVIESDRRP